MSFMDFWNILQTNLTSGDEIRNWTAAKGYLGDGFKVISVSSNAVNVESPNAENLQHITKKEFKVTLDNWGAYCGGSFQRQELRELTRFSKYTISIIKHLEKSLA